MAIFQSYVSLPEGTTPRLSLGTAYSNMFQQMIEPRGTRQLKRAGSPSWVIFSAAKLDYNGDQQNYAPREDKEKMDRCGVWVVISSFEPYPHE